MSFNWVVLSTLSRKGLAYLSALSFGLSIAVVASIGLALNYIPWGIRLHPVMFSLLGFIIILAAVAWYRRRRLPSGERFAPNLGFILASLSHSWASQGRWDRILTILLVAAILSTISLVM